MEVDSNLANGPSGIKEQEEENAFTWAAANGAPAVTFGDQLENYVNQSIAYDPSLELGMDFWIPRIGPGFASSSALHPVIARDVDCWKLTIQSPENLGENHSYQSGSSFYTTADSTLNRPMGSNIMSSSLPAPVVKVDMARGSGPHLVIQKRAKSWSHNVSNTDFTKPHSSSSAQQEAPVTRQDPASDIASASNIYEFSAHRLQTPPNIHSSIWRTSSDTFLENNFILGSSAINEPSFGPSSGQALNPFHTTAQRQHSLDLGSDDPDGRRDQGDGKCEADWKFEVADFNSPAVTGPSGQIVNPIHLHSDVLPHEAANAHVNSPSNVNKRRPQISPISGLNPIIPDGLIINFETNPGTRSVKRKRKVFNEEEKTKVRSVRNVGACFSCHARKIECSQGEPCLRCLKNAGDPHLATQICWRDKFKDDYIGVKKIHGSLWARKDNVQQIVTSRIGTPKQILLRVAAQNEQDLAVIQLEVMQCHSSPRCRWKRLQKINGIYITYDCIYDERYVVLPSSLPSIDQFDMFGRKILSFSSATHCGRLTPLLDAFLLLYCRQNRPSRIRRLVNAALRIASLSGLVAYGFLNLVDGSYDLLELPRAYYGENRRFVSETVHDQIRLLAADGLIPVEELIFSELDNLASMVSSDQHNRIVAGMCLLRLMMVYRERMIRDQIRLGLPRRGKRRTGHQNRLEKAAFMYRRLTVGYKTLSHAKNTPLSMNWEAEPGHEVVEDDATIATLYPQVQAAYEEFCTEMLTHENDDVFRGLVVEPARKDQRKYKKRRLLKGVDG